VFPLKAEDNNLPHRGCPRWFSARRDWCWRSGSNAFNNRMRRVQELQALGVKGLGRSPGRASASGQFAIHGDLDARALLLQQHDPRESRPPQPRALASVISASARLQMRICVRSSRPSALASDCGRAFEELSMRAVGRGHRGMVSAKSLKAAAAKACMLANRSALSVSSVMARSTAPATARQVRPAGSP
jgi:hypothetical protein